MEEGKLFQRGGGSAEPEDESNVTRFIEQWDRSR
jgi:hypothetical protein